MRTLEIENIGIGSALAEEAGVHVLHSIHLNAALLRVLYEAEGIDAGVILCAAAAAAAAQIPVAPSDLPRGQRLEAIARWAEQAGLGRVDLSRLGEDGSGEVRLYESHFARAWTGRFRTSSRPVCAATGELLALLLSRSEGNPIELRETACAAKGASSCVFRAAPARESRGAGISAPAGGELPAAPPPDGAGGPFTRLPAVFHVALALAFEREVPLQRGAKFGNLPGILLLEAAHRGAYHLFGEILAEPEIRALEAGDRLGALLRRIGGMGWGEWEATTFLPGERLIVQVRGSAEAEAHLQLAGRSGQPRCHFSRGAAAAVMNLLFRRDAADAPLGDADYNRVFRSPASFRAVETRCRAMGDPVCEIVANPLTL